MIIQTILAVSAAVMAWLFLLRAWFAFDIKPNETAPHIPPQIVVMDFKHVADVIAASHNNTPVIVFAGAMVAIVGIVAAALVRISDNRRYIPPPYQERLPPPPNQYRSNLPTIRRD